MSREVWDVVYHYIEQGDNETAGDMLFALVDDLILADSYTECDQLLQDLDIDKLNSVLLVMVLVITHHAKDHLPYREVFVSKIEQRLLSLIPDRAHHLLYGRK